MTQAPYRDPVLDEPPPRGFVALIWRWLLLRRQDRLDREYRQSPQLEAPVAPSIPQKPRRVRTTHMVRDSWMKPFHAETVEMCGCPGKGDNRPDSRGSTALSYWVCTQDNCCCEVLDG